MVDSCEVCNSGKSLPGGGGGGGGWGWGVGGGGGWGGGGGGGGQPDVYQVICSPMPMFPALWY